MFWKFFAEQKNRERSCGSSLAVEQEITISIAQIETLVIFLEPFKQGTFWGQNPVDGLIQIKTVKIC